MNGTRKCAEVAPGRNAANSPWSVRKVHEVPYCPWLIFPTMLMYFNLNGNLKARQQDDVSNDARFPGQSQMRKKKTDSQGMNDRLTENPALYSI